MMENEDPKRQGRPEAPILSMEFLYVVGAVMAIGYLLAWLVGR